jgi:hypothetical protein
MRWRGRARCGAGAQRLAAAGEAESVLAALADGAAGSLVAPERFGDARFRPAIGGREIALFAVDGAPERMGARFPAPPPARRRAMRSARAARWR